jgi:hypothetical protein
MVGKKLMPMVPTEGAQSVAFENIKFFGQFLCPALGDV